MRYFTKMAAVAAALSAPVGASAQVFGDLQDFRPFTQEGVNVFEPWLDTTDDPFDGFRLYLGASFAQQFQALDHTNTATPVDVDGVNRNELIDLGWGFNLATANLNLGAQLADGVRVHLVTYLSSRHHPEAWVESGYLLVDEMPFLDSSGIDRLMEHLTFRLGHFAINYGDAHFRRTHNGNAMHNPFVGNLIMDAFTTEIGGEVYVSHGSGLLAMAAVTGGEIRGAVENPDERSPSFYGKLGFDRVLSDDLRIRLTGSAYTTSKSINNTLYFGDRAGSRYYLVVEPVGAQVSSNFTSGRINPVLHDEVTAFVVNPFVDLGSLELFGNFEWADGKLDTETAERSWNQYAGDLVYRFLDDDAYVGMRYNTVEGTLPFATDEVSADRIQVAAGWYPNEYILLKAEWVSQTYEGFPATDIRNGAEFDGFMIEGVVSF